MKHKRDKEAERRYLRESDDISICKKCGGCDLVISRDKDGRATGILCTKCFWMCGNATILDYFAVCTPHKIERIFRKIKYHIHTFYEWYIKGYYHCDQCPYSWECRYEDDADAGCIIKGDIQDTCRLLPPFKNIIGAIRRRQNDYAIEHEYDGFGEWYKFQEAKEREFKRLLLELLEKYAVCYCNKDGTPVLNHEGKICWVDKEHIGESESYRMRCDYEDFITPPRKKLREEWRDLIKRTWAVFTRPIKPFLPRRKHKKRGGEPL